MKYLFLLFCLLHINLCLTQSGSCPPILQLSNDLSSGIYQAKNTLITSSAILENHNVELHAGLEVELESGFVTMLNAEFLATIENCTPVLENSLSWVNYPNSVTQNHTYTVEIDYTLTEPGLIHLLLFDNNWNNIGQDWTVDLPAGTGAQTLSLTVAGTPSVTTNYIQAKLLNTNWIEIGVIRLQEIIPGTNNYTNAINSVTVLDTLEQGATYSIDVDYELAQPGLVYVQYMNKNFMKIGEAWTSTLQKGPGLVSLDVTVDGQLSIGENYVQAQLYDSNWESLGANAVQYSVTINPEVATMFGLIHSNDPPLTEYHTVFPIQYNTYEHGNPNPQSKQLKDAAGSNNYYAYQSNWYVGGHWQGPIKAFFGPVSETGGLNFWMEWDNQQIPDNNGHGPHSETDVRVQKHKWAWASTERGYPTQLSALPASVSCTANGQWTQGSSGRAHINLTTWISNTDNIDDPNTVRCDIIIHAWDNSGDMSANSHFNLIGTLSDNGLVYDVIQRPGDEGEKASFNLVPRRDGLTMQQRIPILEEYPDTNPMDFNIDLKVILSKLMAMAVDHNGNPIFDNSWWLSGSDWTITAQSPAVVGDAAIPASKGRWTFNSYHIPNLN